MLRALSTLLFSALFCVACADSPSSGSSAPDEGISTTDTTNSIDQGVGSIPDADSVVEDVGEGSALGTYPEGPYGVNEGEVLQDLSFQLPEGGEISLSDIRNMEGAKLLMVSTSAGWCTACIEEQPKLQSFYETYGPQGLQVMVSLFQDQNYSPATRALAKQWQVQYNLDIMIVADPDFVWDAYYDSSLTPMNMIVRLEDMTILYLKTGFDESTVEAIIKASL